MEFGILGPLEVRDGGGNRVPLEGVRQERLLAALLLNAESPVPVARLIDAVWDERPPATADRQVRNLAGVLRRRFARADPAGPPVLLTDGGGYRIPLDGHRLDARIFTDRVASARRAAAAEELAAAAAGLREGLALWRGPVLDGLPGRLPATGAVALDELRLTAWEDLLDLEAALGRHRSTIPELTALVAEQPLRERFVGQLMRALHFSGRTADALAVHQLFVGRLADELGLDPSPELKRQHLELLTIEPSGADRRTAAERTAAERAAGERTAGARAAGEQTAAARRAARRAAHDRAAEHPAVGGAASRPEVPERTRAEGAERGRTEAGPASTVPPPAQLPPPLRTFTGRRAELAALDEFAASAFAVPGAPTGPGMPTVPGELAATAAAPIWAISGSAGVGKSSLVVQWAHRVRDRFPGGQLYADLHGFSAGPPLPAHAVLARFLRALGVPGEQVPSVPEEATALYRSLLADRRVLVVLDNARSAEQVRPLLPGTPRCVTVVTSRTRLAGLTARDGARPLVVDLMPASDAVALLDRVIGGRRALSEPAACAELAAVCGRLPLALAIAASRLAERPDLTVADHAAELRDAEDRLTALQIEGDAASAVRAAFDLSYRALPARARNVFRLLALAPAADLCTAAAAALCGERVVAVRPVLEQLATAHLLTHEGRDWYRMHDLLRLYAAERATAETDPAERTAARERLYTWYLHHADAAARLLTPHRRRIPLASAGSWYESKGFATAAEAQRWCEGEHAHLLGAVRTAAEHGLDDLAWQLPVVLWGYYFISPHLDDWEEADRLAVAAARRAGDRHGEGHARNDLATALAARGRYDEALPELLSARALLASIGDEVGEAHVIGNLGLHSHHTGAHEQAREYFLQSLALLLAQPDDHRDDWAIGVCWTNLGATAMLTGRSEEADTYLHRALDRHRSTRDTVLESLTLFALGDHHRRLDRRDEAAARLRQALAVIDGATANPRLRADVLAALAELGEQPDHGDRSALGGRSDVGDRSELGEPAASPVPGY
ncbi:BTAD domain-containing putative transcriptional regulator [Kitasatospora sp. NPDC059327]|uniref:AfsR/SARP family transcriptional regulator n=1 Tax=Kitasatospora sp. NPDC059327 TaxID=3346803 RepID=UPI00368E3A7C